MADPTDLPQTDPRGPDPSQLSTFLPSTTVFITGHDEAGKSRVHESRSSKWTPFDDKKMAMTTVYSNEAQPDFNDDADLKTAQEDSTTLRSLVKRGGTVIRQVDMQPGYKTIMHRTQSLDFGIVVEGECEMITEDGTTTLLRRGDVAVQRGTQHAWRNPSDTQWARMTFVLQESKPLEIDGKTLGEDISGGPSGISSS